jgi:hypothetical protein
MDRYIKIQDIIDETDDRYTLGEIGRMERDIIVNAVENCTISYDIPVTRGEWIEKQDKDGKTYGVCSCCGYKQYAGHLKYCPECGSENNGPNQ